MADSVAGSGSLVNAFKKVNHYRMVLMDISMMGLIIGGIVATGGVTGFLDPVIAWLKMHVSGIPALFTGGPEFLSSAFQQASNGVWFTGIDPGSMHAMHGTGAAVAAAPAVVPVVAPTPAVPVQPPVVDHSMHMMHGKG